MATIIIKIRQGNSDIEATSNAGQHCIVYTDGMFPLPSIDATLEHCLDEIETALKEKK